MCAEFLSSVCETFVRSELPERESSVCPAPSSTAVAAIVPHAPHAVFGLVWWSVYRAPPHQPKHNLFLSLQVSFGLSAANVCLATDTSALFSSALNLFKIKFTHAMRLEAPARMKLALEPKHRRSSCVGGRTQPSICIQACARDHLR